MNSSILPRKKPGFAFSPANADKIARDFQANLHNLSLKFVRFKYRQDTATQVWITRSCQLDFLQAMDLEQVIYSQILQEEQEDIHYTTVVEHPSHNVEGYGNVSQEVVEPKANVDPEEQEVVINIASSEQPPNFNGDNVCTSSLANYVSTWRITLFCHFLNKYTYSK